MDEIIQLMWLKQYVYCGATFAGSSLKREEFLLQEEREMMRENPLREEVQHHYTTEPAASNASFML